MLTLLLFLPDRELQIIPPKGRPISQCQHCRSLRRSKSAHVKCDCGEKTAKCPHLKPTVEGHQSTCCCHHGAPCTCCHKKAAHRAEAAAAESDPAKTTTDAKPAKPTRRRRSKTNNTLPDTALTFDEHGHHKPTYKHTKASQKSGPYQLHRSHSTQSSISTRSPESLSLDSFGNAYSNDALAGLSQMPDQRLTKSETASPLPDGLPVVTPAGLPAALAPIQTDIQDAWSQPWGSASSQPDSLFTGAEEQDSIVSAGISPAADFNLYSWPAFDTSGYNFLDSLPALTSGEGSENEAFDNEADDFISPGIGLTPFGSLTRTNTSSSIFSLDPHNDLADVLPNDDTGKFYDPAAHTTLDQTDSVFNSAPPPPATGFDEHFSQWMDMVPDQGNNNLPMWGHHV